MTEQVSVDCGCTCHRIRECICTYCQCDEKSKLELERLKRLDENVKNLIEHEKKYLDNFEKNSSVPLVLKNTTKELIELLESLYK